MLSIEAAGTCIAVLAKEPNVLKYTSRVVAEQIFEKQ